MSEHIGITQLATHDVTNQPTPLVNINLFDSDLALKEALSREGASWAMERAHEFGQLVGSGHCISLAFEANRYTPELKAFNRYGHRIDEVPLLGLHRGETLHLLRGKTGAILVDNRL